MSAVPAGWSSFFAAEVGAAAALTGLLFIAVSINLPKILDIAHLPSRAAESIMILCGVLGIASFGLVPAQSLRAFGLEVGLIGILLTLATARMQFAARKDPVARQWMLGRVLSTQLANIPILVAAALLVRGNDAGLYWIVPGVILSFALGIMNAWVLLIEILR